eukprot:Gb_35136 [translate_table: standard]
MPFGFLVVPESYSEMPPVRLERWNHSKVVLTGLRFEYSLEVPSVLLQSSIIPTDSSDHNPLDFHADPPGSQQSSFGQILSLLPPNNYKQSLLIAHKYWQERAEIHVKEPEWLLTVESQNSKINNLIVRTPGKKQQTEHEEVAEKNGGCQLLLLHDQPTHFNLSVLCSRVRRHLLGLVGDEANAASILGANFSAGFIAGSVAAAATCPLDVAKTRRQIEKDPMKAMKTSTRQTLTNVWRDGGVRGLFMGVGPRVGRAGPSVGIVVSFYEVVKYMLHQSQAASSPNCASHNLFSGFALFVGGGESSFSIAVSSP